MSAKVVTNPRKRRWIARRGERMGVSKEAPLFLWEEDNAITLNSAIVKMTIELPLDNAHQPLRKWR